MAERIEIIIDADSGRVVSESRRASAAISSLGRTVSGQTRGAMAFNSVVAQQRQNLAQLAGVARTATLAVGAFATAVGALAIREGLEFNATMESNELALKRFVGGTKEARKFLDELFETAKKTPFQFTDLTAASRRLLAFGLDVERTQDIMQSLGDALAAMGGSAEHIERVTMAIGQIQAKGRVQAEELLQIAEAGIPVYQILREELGLSMEQVRNIGNEAIPAAKAFDALVQGMNKRFAGAAAQQAKTFDGQLATLRDNTSQTLGAMTEGLFNELKEWLPEVNATAEDIAAIWKRDDLTPEQKFAKSREAIDRNLGELFAEIERRWEDLDLGDKAVEAFNDALPKLAEAAGKGAAKVAEAFATGFVESDIWGKAVLGALLISKMGLGPVIFRRAGTQAAAAYASGMAQPGVMGVPYTAGGPTPGGRLRSLGAGALRFGGQLSLLSAATGLAADPSERGFGGRLQNAASAATFGLLPGVAEDQAKAFEEVSAAISDAGGNTEELRSIIDGLIPAMEEMGAITSEQAEELRRFGSTAETTATRASNVLRAKLNLDEIEFGWTRSMRRMAGISEKEIGRIDTLLQEKPRKGVQALDRAMDDMVGSIREAMRSGEMDTRKGLQAIHSILLDQLAMYGIEGADAEKIIKAKQEGSKVGKGDKAGFSGLQRGGFINQGAASGDSVPSLLELGEYVLNRNAVRAMGGKAALDAINFGMAARFQAGGYAGVSGDTDFSPALGKALSRMAKATGQSIFVQSGGRTLAEQAALYAAYQSGTGNLAAPPNPNAPHVRGIAADITPGREVFGSAAGRFGLGFTVPSESWHIELLNAALASGAASVSGGRVRINLPRFQAAAAAFTPGAAGLNRFAEGIERVMGRRAGAAMPEGTGGGAISAGGVGSWQAALRRIAKQRGWSAGDWMSLVMKESGGDPTATNPSSGAFGLGQFLGATAQAYAKFGALSSNPVKQIEAMARYIADRYGDPSAALAFHNANNWYAQGGLVGLQSGSFVGRGGFTNPLGGASWLDQWMAAQAEREEARAARRAHKRDIAKQAREVHAEARTGRLLGRSLGANLGPLLEGLGLPYVGAFDKGTFRVPRTGLATVHRGEEIRRGASVQTADRPVKVELTFNGDTGQLVRLVDARIDGRAADVVDRELGRRSRRMSFAPGV